MAIRTTSAAVEALMAPGEDYDLANNPSLTGFIASASMVTDNVVACAAKKGITLTAANLELIERWLTAYFYTRSDATYQSKGTDGQSASFVADKSPNASTERYKDGAMAVDPSGCVNALLNNLRASSVWLGKNPSDQIDYVDRS